LPLEKRKQDSAGSTSDQDEPRQYLLVVKRQTLYQYTYAAVRKA